MLLQKSPNRYTAKPFLAALGGLSLLVGSQLVVSGENLEHPDSIDLTKQLEGQFQTYESDTENRLADRRMRINPLGDGEWMYTQVNSGEELKLYRQRIMQFVDTDFGVEQKAYKLVNPEDFVGLWNHPDKVESLTMESLEPYLDDGCNMLWNKAPDSEFIWHGKIDHKVCTIYSERRQSKIHIGAESRISTAELQQTERGFDQQGEQLFGTDPGAFIRLQRIN